MSSDCLILHVPKFLNYYEPWGYYTSINFVPIGLVPISNLLNSNNIKTEVLHLGVQTIENPAFSIADYVKEARPKLVAFDLHWHHQTYDVLNVARNLRRSFPEIKIVLGGSTASFFGKQILAQYPFVDFVIRGDGEVPLLKLFEAMQAKDLAVFSRVPNLVFRDGDKIVENPVFYVATSKDLDALDFSNFSAVKNLAVYQKMSWRYIVGLEKNRNTFEKQATLFSVSVGRGCTVSCSYCGGSAISHKVISHRCEIALRSPDKIVNSIEAAMGQGFEVFHFSFDPYPQNPQIYFDLFAGLRSRRLRLKVYFESFGLPTKKFMDDFKHTFNKDSIIVISPEVGSEKMRKIHRGNYYSNEELFETIFDLNKLKIKNNLFFSFGLPLETKEDVWETVALQRYIRRHFKGSGVFALPIELEPGSPSFLEPEKYQMKLKRKTVADFYADHRKPELRLGYDTSNFSEKEILDLRCKYFCVLGKRFGRLYCKLLVGIRRALGFLILKFSNRKGKVRPKMETNKNVLLIEIFSSNWYYRFGELMPSMGLLYMGSVLKKAGYKVKLVDTQQPDFSVDYLFAVIDDFKPGLVAISSNQSDNFPAARRLVENLKTKYPDIPLALGGTHPSFNADVVLTQIKADYLVRHEGEQTLLELVKMLLKKNVFELIYSWLKRKNDLSRIKGLSYRDNEKIMHNPERELIENLDLLPFPDRELLPKGVSYAGAIISGRGCGYRCSTCVQWKRCGKFRLRSPENIFEEIKLLYHKYGKKIIYFMDDAFMGDMQRVEALCQMLIREFKTRDFFFYAEGFIDKLAQNKPLIHLMQKAGLSILHFAIESGSEDNINLYERKTKLSEVKEVIKECASAGVDLISCSFYVGGICDTKKTTEETIAFAKELVALAPGRCFAESLFLPIYKGTPIYENMAEYGLVPVDKDFETGDGWLDPFYRTKELSFTEIKDLKTRFDHEIGLKLFQQVPLIKKGLVDRYAKMSQQKFEHVFWAAFYKNAPTVVNYYRLLSNDYIQSIKDIPKEDILDWCPARNVSYNEFKEQAITIMGRQIKLELVDYIIVMLSSGKLTFKEVIEHTIEEFKDEGKKLSFDELFERAYTLYNTMDDNFAIVFREI